LFIHGAVFYTSVIGIYDQELALELRTVWTQADED